MISNLKKILLISQDQSEKQENRQKNFRKKLQETRALLIQRKKLRPHHHPRLSKNEQKHQILIPLPQIQDKKLKVPLLEGNKHLSSNRPPPR